MLIVSTAVPSAEGEGDNGLKPTPPPITSIITTFKKNIYQISTVVN